jgi:hypothetical protein
MSTATTARPATAPPGAPPRREITLISHSMLFYWWPIWFLGFLFAAITYFEDHRLAILPADSTVRVEKDLSDKAVTAYTLRVKETTKSLEEAVRATDSPEREPTFTTRVSQKAWLGPLFCIVLLLTVIVTNVPLRGLWSFLVLLLILILALLVSIVPGGWDSLLSAVRGLHIYINMAGYLFIATAVFVIWAISVFIFDQRTYMRVTPGSIQVCEHIGASIRNFDTTGLAFEKQRDDIFRHWILGFFSGDLVVKTAGASAETIRLPNVLFISWRLEQVQDLLRQKATVSNNP